MKKCSPSYLLFVAALTVTAMSGCDLNYWWTRGQPPSTRELLERADKTLGEQISAHSEERSAIIPQITALRASLSAMAEASKAGDREKLTSAIALVEGDFIALEGKLFVGSRAPYYELSGQLRVLRDNTSSGSPPEFNTVGLFAARTFFLLASDLEMPAPAA